MLAHSHKKFIAREAAKLREGNRVRQIPPVDHGAERYLLHAGRRLLNLASNNYLGLAGHPALRQGAIEAVERYGTSSGASRLVSGNFALLDELEREMSSFKGQEDALVVGSGFAANLMILSSLADRHTVVFSDRLNHASIVDGIRLSGAKHVRYRHNDTDHLAKLLEAHAGAPRKVLVTDTVFSMDGDIADLATLVDLCQRHGVLSVVDEAHAAGIFGNGRGLAAQLGLADRVDIHMGTFSKGFGSYGAYIAGKAEIIGYLRNTGRPFIFSTALPPAVVGASLAAVRLVREADTLGRRLLDMARDVREYLGSLGLDVGSSRTAIIPVMLGGNEAALAARDALVERGVLVGAIRPPTVPQNTARLRISLRADLTDADLTLFKTAVAQMTERV
ncbi:8-amino-7-oxononanoate synthase [Pseudodesulfovibrio sp. F-1]|uniref:8-amino-7-ketopelargonate synthase n=1 Tax=Pseudodesulfovibrio alkaliphilus TaxID=2661613 RepID=A0A7K1KRR4_9BACT|nr:8-amino-7-oxononanoate synthase [Pseudodesulfovibrio alkaliphilus]MUM78622.1 8-amino-7-oxononanoate synthase [Pseudodesulfovibrio alkaliphilus]